MSSGAPQWYFNAAANPFSPTHTPTWTPYSAEDNAKIEQEFQNKAQTATLQQHVIYFQERMQVHKSDFNRQRPIKREPKP